LTGIGRQRTGIECRRAAGNDLRHGVVASAVIAAFQRMGCGIVVANRGIAIEGRWCCGFRPHDSARAKKRWLIGVGGPFLAVIEGIDEESIGKEAGRCRNRLHFPSGIYEKGSLAGRSSARVHMQA